MTAPTCNAPAVSGTIGGPRCGKPARFDTPTGPRCAACAEVFREALREPSAVKMLHMVLGRVSRALSPDEIEQEISKVVRPLAADPTEES